MRSLCLAAAIGLSACDTEVLRPELRDGCELPRACQVVGVDVVLDTPVLLVSDDHPRDPVTGRAVFQPGETVRLEVTVWNRGDRTSSAGTVTMWIPNGSDDNGPVQTPALAPGAVFTDTVEMNAPEWLGYASDTAHVWAERGPLITGEDPLHANDGGRSETFVVALPMLRATLDFPDTIRAEEPFSATVTLHNESRFGDLAPGTLAFCLWDFDAGCGSWAGLPFGLTAMPAIEAEGEWTTTLTITITEDADYYGGAWSLYACPARPGVSPDEIVDWRQLACIGEARSIHLEEAAGVQTAISGGAS